MNIKRLPIRTVVALGAAAALTLASCGGGDDSDDAVPSTTAETPDEEPATTSSLTLDDQDGDGTGNSATTSPASITFEAQDSDGTSVIVAAAELPAAGFIAVHSDGGGSPGPVIGVSDLLPSGSATDVTVVLDSPLDAATTLFPMVHIDTDGNGVYEFGAVEGVDGPGVTAEGDVAVTGAQVTVTADEVAAPGDENTITIADFAFGGVTEVAVGTTVTVSNTDGTPHTWTADAAGFDSGSLGQNDSFEFTFTEAGEFTYHCNFHPSMTGTIVVTG